MINPLFSLFWWLLRVLNTIILCCVCFFLFLDTERISWISSASSLVYLRSFLAHHVATIVLLIVSPTNILYWCWFSLQSSWQTNSSARNIFNVSIHCRMNAALKKMIFQLQVGFQHSSRRTMRYDSIRQMLWIRQIEVNRITESIRETFEFFSTSRLFSLFDFFRNMLMIFAGYQIHIISH